MAAELLLLVVKLKPDPTLSTSCTGWPSCGEVLCIAGTRKWLHLSGFIITTVQLAGCGRGDNRSSPTSS